MYAYACTHGTVWFIPPLLDFVFITGRFGANCCSNIRICRFYKTLESRALSFQNTDVTLIWEGSDNSIQPNYCFVRSLPDPRAGLRIPDPSRILGSRARAPDPGSQAFGSRIPDPADPGSRIPDPKKDMARIPDPKSGLKTQNKNNSANPGYRRGECILA